MTTIIILAVLALLVAYFIFSYRKMKNIPEVEKNEKIADLTDKNFRHQIRNGISLVDFWASWCMPCKMMAPVLNEVADEVHGKAMVCKVDVERFQSLATDFGIRGIPTMVLFRNGKEIDRFVGMKSKEFILNQIFKAE